MDSVGGESDDPHVRATGASEREQRSPSPLALPPQATRTGTGPPSTSSIEMGSTVPSRSRSNRKRHHSIVPGGRRRAPRIKAGERNHPERRQDQAVSRDTKLSPLRPAAARE
jgi:hypothetical protein